MDLNPLWAFTVSECCEFSCTSGSSALAQKSARSCKLQNQFRGPNKVSFRVPQLQRECEFDHRFLSELAQTQRNVLIWPFRCQILTGVLRNTCNIPHEPIMWKMQIVALWLLPDLQLSLNASKFSKTFSIDLNWLLSIIQKFMSHKKACTALPVSPGGDSIPFT